MFSVEAFMVSLRFFVGSVHELDGIGSRFRSSNTTYVGFLI